MDPLRAEIEAAYRRYFPIIRAKCARTFGDAAEAQDVAQETFTRLWHQRASIRDPRAVSGWIYRTATRLSVERLQRARRLQLDSELGDSALTLEPNPESRAVTRGLLASVARQTPELELEVAMLSLLDGLTHDQVAEVVGRNERTVRRLLDRFEKRVSRWSKRNR